MKATVKQTLALWLSVLLISISLLPAIAFADSSSGSGGSGTVQDNVYGCKELSSPNAQGWRDQLKPKISKVSDSKIKVTFTMHDGFCKTFSFTSYAYKDNVKPQYNGGPFAAQYVNDNVTAYYKAGPHNVEINLPCGYWQTDLYVGPVITV